MDNKKIGQFITNLRKDKKFTQKELAAKLFVSDKAVSKWERGLAMPDIGLLERLADCLDANVSEILKGEKIDNIANARSDEIVKDGISFFQNKITKISVVIILSIFIGYFAILCIGEMTYGTLRWNVFDGEYTIDLPSFSAKRDRKKAERFLKALQNNDYDAIKSMLKPNESRWYLAEEEKFISLDDYIANLEKLKNDGFKIINYKYIYSYFRSPSYVCKFEITFVINSVEFNITAQIQGFGNGVIVDGASMGSSVGKIFEY